LRSDYSNSNPVVLTNKGQKSLPPLPRFHPDSGTNQIASSLKGL
jgi:hypothetical protein